LEVGRSSAADRDVGTALVSMFSDLYEPDEFRNPDEADYARGRLTERLYLSRTFTSTRVQSRDYGASCRFVHRVFDSATEPPTGTEEYPITTIGSSRTQLKALVTREQGNVTDLWLQAVPSSGALRQVLHLRRDDVARFIDTLVQIRLTDPREGEETTRIDDALVAAFLRDPDAVATLYGENSASIRRLIADDEAAQDVIAIAHRRAVVARFERLLGDDSYFDAEMGGGGPEAVWQEFFEQNPWILGLGLSEQLLTGWNADKLETVVSGADVTGHGKRVDALLRTSGIVKSMVFAEIKHHRTRLLARAEYRPGNYAPSRELAGGVAQSQGTVHQAVEQISHRIQAKDAEGFDAPGDFTYLVRPRSYLVVGQLDEFVTEAGAQHDERITSFELYRRHMREPEIVTFDELLARARWLVQTTEQPARED
jgi:hypothetical protein